MEKVESAVHMIDSAGSRQVAVTWPGETKGEAWEATRGIVLAAEGYMKRVMDEEERINFTEKGRTEFRQKEAKVAILEIDRLDKSVTRWFNRAKPDAVAKLEAAERELIPPYTREPAAVHVDLAILAVVDPGRRLVVADRAVKARDIEDADVGRALARLPRALTQLSVMQVDAIREAVIAQIKPEALADLNLMLAQLNAASEAAHYAIRRIVAHANVSVSLLHGWSSNAFDRFRSEPGQVASLPRLAPESQQGAAAREAGLDGVPGLMVAQDAE